MLTAKQHELWLFLADRASQSPVSPSFDEMRTHLGLASKSGIHRLLSALEERQFIRRYKARARAIEVLKSPADEKLTENLCAHLLERSHSLHIALSVLVNQIEINDFTDSLGHKARHLKAYHDARSVLPLPVDNHD